MRKNKNSIRSIKERLNGILAIGEMANIDKFEEVFFIPVEGRVSFENRELIRNAYLATILYFKEDASLENMAKFLVYTPGSTFMIDMNIGEKMEANDEYYTSETMALRRALGYLCINYLNPNLPNGNPKLTRLKDGFMSHSYQECAICRYLLDKYLMCSLVDETAEVNTEEKTSDSTWDIYNNILETALGELRAVRKEIENEIENEDGEISIDIGEENSDFLNKLLNLF